MASDIVFLAYAPPGGAVDVTPATDLFVSLYSPTGVDPSTFVMTVDGVDAVTYDGAGLVFTRPAFAGTVTSPSALFLLVRVQPRRPFLYNVNPAVSVVVRSLGVPGEDATLDFDFAVRGPAGTLVDVGLRAARVERTLNLTPALEVYRQAMLDALRGTPATPAIAALTYRVAASSLRGVLQSVPTATAARAELPNLRAGDVGSWDAGAASVERLAPLWETSLRELPRLGVDAGTLRLVFAAGSSPNGPERVAAACAAVLLAAQKHQEIEDGTLRVPLP